MNQNASHQPNPGLFSYLGKDLTAGLVVFLVALPLCLGVALASDAPLISGLAAGVVGGLVVGAISGSRTSVSGPAAGLTAIVAAQINQLGSFQAFLLAVLLAGVMQIALGVLKAGSIAAFFPSSVIKGLLAAIGVILILKQIPHVLGHDPDPIGEMAFEQPDHQNTFSELFQTLFDIHSGAALIGMLSLALLFSWDRIPFMKKAHIPAPLAVVCLGLGLNQLFSGSMRIAGEHLVQVPVIGAASEAAELLSFPAWAEITNPGILVAAVTIAIVATLETLLNLEAVDNLDPSNRHSPPNRELVAQGVGNMVCGLIGALPVTSVIVRSSVNISSGNKTKLSTLFHGALLLSTVLFVPELLNQIPLSCLAAILIVTGLKLANPKRAKQMWSEGLPQFLPFVITVLAIVVTDLLVGILIGLGVAVAFILRSNFQRPIRHIREQHVAGEVLRIELSNQVSFLNKASLQRCLDSVPNGGRVVVDASHTDYMDPDVVDLLADFQTAQAPSRDIQVSIVGFKQQYSRLENGPQIVDYSTRELQDQLTPDHVLEILKEGNRRFRSGQRLHRDLVEEVNATQNQESPLAVVLSCIESRAPVELIFDLGIGDVLGVRVAAHVARAKVLASMEYSCLESGAKVILVLGHTNCGVIEAAMGGCCEELSRGSEHWEDLVGEIRASARLVPKERLKEGDSDAAMPDLDDVARAHVMRTMGDVVEKSPAIRRLIDAGKVAVVGGLYDVRTGEVELFAGPSGVSRAAASLTEGDLSQAV